MAIPALDALLSLPFVSFIVLPSAISNFPWTTSLNLIFFWLTWATVVLSHSPLNIEFYGTLAIRVLFYVLPCALFLLLDSVLPSFAAGIKWHGNRGLAKQALADSSVWNYVGVVLFNILLSVSLQTGFNFGWTSILRLSSTVRVSVALPMPLGLAKDLTRAYLVRGPLTYYIHAKLLHAPRTAHWMRKTVTRWHQSWNHSLQTTMPFGAAYDHPLVFVLHSFVPVYLPVLLFQFHILTYFFFLALIGLEEAFAWSGYSTLPSTVLLAGIARRREAHMMIGGGNYGPWGIMDWIHGTTIGDSDAVEDIVEEAEKRDVGRRTRRAVRDVGEAVAEPARSRQKEAATGLGRSSSSSESQQRRRTRKR